jgi:FdhE protein
VSIDTEAALVELRRVAANLAETTELGSAAHRAAEVVRSSDVDLTGLVGAVLSGERGPVERAGAELDVDGEALARMIDLALQPFLWEAARSLGALVDIDVWERGYCPVCGAWPALAELVGPEKKRHLRCVRCGSDWTWLVLLCPYCGNDDHRTLRVLQAPGSAERVDVCERCHGYVKALPAYTPNPPARLVAEDVATMDLDVAASAAGYARPGQVEVRTAGIPRTVRER